MNNSFERIGTYCDKCGNVICKCAETETYRKGIEKIFDKHLELAKYETFGGGHYTCSNCGNLVFGSVICKCNKLKENNGTT